MPSCLSLAKLNVAHNLTAQNDNVLECRPLAHSNSKRRGKTMVFCVVDFNTFLVFCVCTAKIVWDVLVTIIMFCRVFIPKQNTILIYLSCHSTVDCYTFKSFSLPLFSALDGISYQFVVNVLSQRRITSHSTKKKKIPRKTNSKIVDSNFNCRCK